MSGTDWRGWHPNGLYVVGLSIHGLVRGTGIELGRDADTGGQILYTVDQARALATLPEVRQVDLITRQIFDQRIDESYSVEEEWIAPRARIARLPFGPRRYLYKESLWPYLDSLVDQCVRYIRTRRRVPDIIHGHYADAGYVGSRLSKILGVPFVFTGHSLGRVKKSRLLQDGISDDDVEKRYRIYQRIEAEEQALETAALVIASTKQEVREQYELYEHYVPENMVVIPPGVDLDRFSPPDPDWSRPSVMDPVSRFLKDPDKPMILAIARPDERKNFHTLIRAYAQTPGLADTANLILIAGTRDDIAEMEAGARRVLNQILGMVDRFNLYGSVAYPKQVHPSDIPDLYRAAAHSGGIFVNPALTEPFGLTLLEAAASGLPIVATADGGPTDIIETCQNGVLVDPLDAGAMGKAMLDAFESEGVRQGWAENGIRLVHQHFSWNSHAQSYLDSCHQLLSRVEGVPAVRRSRRSMIDRMIICDIDNTLTGDPAALDQFRELLRARDPRIGFGIATGRTRERASEILEELELLPVDLLITETGTGIYYGSDAEFADRSWLKQIDYQWNPRRLIDALGDIPGIRVLPYPDSGQFRVVGRLDPETAPSEGAIRRQLRNRGLRVTCIFDYGVDLDIIPIRASRGMALRFICYKWDLSPDHLLIAGDSGNDADMLRGDTLGVVVANHAPELEALQGSDRVYFSGSSHARGVLEGIDHYDFFGAIRSTETHMPAENDRKTAAGTGAA